MMSDQRRQRKRWDGSNLFDLTLTKILGNSSNRGYVSGQEYALVTCSLSLMYLMTCSLKSSVEVALIIDSGREFHSEMSLE